MRARKVLLRGAKLTCPFCRRVMAILLVDLSSGDKIRSDMFKNVDGNIGPQRKMECPFDGTAYGEAGKLHVFEKGWI